LTRGPAGRYTRARMQTIAVTNQKGGVGKSTVAVHLAVGLARAGHRVLVVDLDKQAHATLWLLGEVPTAQGVAELLTGRDWQARRAQEREGLDVLAGTDDLPDAEIKLQMRGGALALRRGLEKLGKGYDYAVLDTPPNLGLLVINALAAADGVVVPVLPNYPSLLGLAELDATLGHVRAELQLAPRLLGYLLFGVNARKALPEESRERLETQAPGRLLKAEVRVSANAESLLANRTTAWDPGADPRGAEDYPAVLAEVLERLAPQKRKRAHG
jgi:chromosome partitioning protein